MEVVGRTAGNLQDFQDVPSTGQRRFRRGLRLSGQSYGKDVRLQEIGEETNKEEKRRGHGTHREEYSSED